MMNLRNQDAYTKSLYDFLDTVFVVCPSCQAQAQVHGTASFFAERDIVSKVRVTCAACGYSRALSEKSRLQEGQHPKSRESKKRPYVFGGGIDPFFHLPLWLKATIGQNLFWAYNYEHLEYIRAYIAAGLRERQGFYHYNNSIGSRLPRWVKEAGKRESLLKAIDTLKKKK